MRENVAPQHYDDTNLISYVLSEVEEMVNQKNLGKQLRVVENC